MTVSVLSFKWQRYEKEKGGNSHPFVQALALASRGVLPAVICAERHVIVLSCPDSEHAIMGTCEATIKLHKTL